MALAENLHHSRQKVEGDEHEGPRAQKTARVSGARPGVLTELEPQGGAATVGYVAAPGPLLEVALMAGGDSVDGTALRFLVKKALDRQKEEQAKVKRQEEEKEERRMQRLNAKVSNDIPLTPEEREAWRRWILAYDSSSSSSGKRRKRKKRRKRRLPKSSSRSSSGYGRSCDHQRRVPAVQEVRVHSASDSVHRRRLDILVVQQRQIRGFMVHTTAVVPQLQFLVGRRHSLSCRRDRSLWSTLCCRPQRFPSCRSSFGGRCPCCAVVSACCARVDNGRPRLVMLVTMRLGCVPLGCCRPMMLGIMAGMVQMDSCSDMYSAGIAGDNAPRAVFFLLVRRPMMLGIMAGMVQMDSCSDMYSAGIAGDNAPHAVFFLLVRRPMMLDIMAGMVQMDSCSGMYGWYSWCQCTSRCVPLVRRPMMIGIMSVMDQKNTFARLWSRQCKLSGSAAVPQLQFFADRHHPCCGALASHGPDCPSNHRDSPVAREQGDRCPCYAVRAGSTGRPHPCRDVEADPHGLVDHGDSALALGQGGRCPVGQVVRVSQVLSWRCSVCSHSSPVENLVAGNS